MPPFSRYVGSWLGPLQLLEMHRGSLAMFCVSILAQLIALKIITHLVQAHMPFKNFSPTKQLHTTVGRNHNHSYLRADCETRGNLGLMYRFNSAKPWKISRNSVTLCILCGPLFPPRSLTFHFLWFIGEELTVSVAWAWQEMWHLSFAGQMKTLTSLLQYIPPIWKVVLCKQAALTGK